MSPFAKIVRAELIAARARHGAQHSAHESYAVIQEEVDEFWDLVKTKKPNRESMLMELVQIAAMSQRAAEDLGLIDQEAFES